MADVLISSWTRLEPRSQSADPSVGLSAALADPLWLLARQWQFAEFVGDDGATPVRVRVRAGWSPITRWHPGPVPAGGVEGRPFDPSAAPLEAMIEAEAAGPDEAFRWSADTGRRAERLLRAAGLDTVADALRARFPLAAPPATDITDNANDALVGLLATRLVDGTALRAAHVPAGIPAGVDPGADDPGAAATVLDGWATWYDTRAATRPAEQLPPSWIADRLEYRFAVAAPLPGGEEVVLTSPEYHGDGLDWDDFDIAPAGTTIGAAADTARLPADVRLTETLPQPVRWPGAPADRFWEMEDAAVDLGRLDAWPTDLATMLAAEFCLIGSTDWFTLPMRLPVGSVAWLESVVVQDTFGDCVIARTEPGEVGRLFEAAPAPGDPVHQAYLVLPPTVVGGVQGTAIEDVLLLRDQLANLAWAVEHTAPGPAGLPVDVAAALARRPGPDLPAQALPTADVRYRPAVLPPDNWVPLTPVLRADGDRRGTRLARTRVVGGGEPLPATRLVREITELAEEEVPRDGRRVRRSRQRARWVDGSTWVWNGRLTGPGRGDGSSGLRFDGLEAPPT